MLATPRSRTLPARGRLLVNTDLHGNLEDYEALESLFLAALAQGEDIHWALLGDLVHGPNAAAARSEPALYGYEDQSPALIERVLAMKEWHPERVHVVLGNHDHGHVGGRHTAKFHGDEVTHLEARQSEPQRRAMHALFEQAALVLLAPCGALLSHGSPGDELHSLSQLDGPLARQGSDLARWAAIQSVLWSYGQTRERTEAMLARVGAEVGFSLRFVLHGHDREERGWYTEGGNQAQPVLFGALRSHKRYLWLDLAARYESVDALREGHELRRLYPPGAMR